MKFKKMSHAALFCGMVLVFFLSACNSERSKSETDAAAAMPDTAAAASATAGTDAGAAANEGSTRSPEWYVYTYGDDVEAAGYDEASAGKLAKGEGSAVKSDAAKKPMPQVKAKPVVYTVSQTDSPPLFSKECLTDKDPDKCSNEKLEDWVRQNVKFPKADLAEGSDGLELVTFVINQRGKISTIQSVDTKKEACRGCAKAVLDAVVAMPDWSPAMKDGKPVPVIVTLPVRFRAL